VAQDIFLKLVGIAGESNDATHKDEIEVLSWSWKVSQPSGMHAGSGGGSGKAAVDDLTFHHYVDRASPNLAQFCLTGKHIPEAVLVMRKAGGNPLEYLKITMEDVLITNVRPFFEEGMRAMREKVQLSFARVRQEYVIQNALGGSGGTVSAGYDIKSNKTI
jgi:type VI secretion system secreted protein Hcp